MPAYAVFSREMTRDKAELDAYSAAVGPSFAGVQMTPRVAYGQIEVMEGPQVEGMVVLEFPTFEEAKAWYQSPAYTEARKHRHLGADYRCAIVQGL